VTTGLPRLAAAGTAMGRTTRTRANCFGLKNQLNSDRFVRAVWKSNANDDESLAEG